MKHANILAAEKEAQRFLEAVKAYRHRRDTDEYFAMYSEITGGRETATVRRASMDLTHALSDMRKP
jgi:hypothetical protein